MNNIKNINPIPKNVFDSFEQEDHGFLIKAIVKNGQAQYQNISIHVASMDEVYKNISPEHVIRFRVFSIGSVIAEVEGVTRMKAKEFVAMQAKEKRLAQYLELKKEFESQAIPEETLN